MATMSERDTLLNYYIETISNGEVKDFLLELRERRTLPVLGEAATTEKAASETTLIDVPDDFCMSLPVTKCCKIGPITNENYCPNCGKKIKRAAKTVSS